MANPDQIGDFLIGELEKDFGNLAPIILKLREYTGKSKGIEPSEDSQQHKTWGKIVGKLQHKKLFLPAKQVAEAWYVRVSELQQENNERYHKGSSTQSLANCFMLMGDFSQAAWFYTLAFVEDVISSYDENVTRAPATIALQIYFGRSEEQLKSIAVAANRMRQSKQMWQFFYPEAVAVSVKRDKDVRITVTVHHTPPRRKIRSSGCCHRKIFPGDGSDETKEAKQNGMDQDLRGV